jgi:alpha-amylase/alpha-mannosidase (GH57 family)
MVQILGKYPKIHQTINLVPSLLEQIEDYAKGTVKDKYLELSLKPAAELSDEEKAFIRDNFFSVNKERIISTFPRYYELYLANLNKKSFTTQDYLDLQVLFNLGWIDPIFRQNYPELRDLVYQARFFREEQKQVILHKQLEILEQILPAYKKFGESKQVEIITSPYYHPILPLLYNVTIAKEANWRTILPKVKFAYPQDAKTQIDEAVGFFKSRFGAPPCGMWPSEEAVSEHILPFIIQAGINWIVADEAILFKSLGRKKRDTELLYQPHLIKRKDGNLNIVFRDRNLSDLIGFVYHSQSAKAAVDDFMKHLENIHTAHKGRDILVTIAMDGENAWEYYPNDGHDFLDMLYTRLSDSQIIRTTTISEYLQKRSPQFEIKRLAAGSWIYGEFGKWIGHPLKARAWECLAKARQELEEAAKSSNQPVNSLAWKQMHILEGSDWFWWYGEDPGGNFDRLFRMHLANFYRLINKDAPDYLKNPLTT